MRAAAISAARRSAESPPRPAPHSDRGSECCVHIAPIPAYCLAKDSGRADGHESTPRPARSVPRVPPPPRSDAPGPRAPDRKGSAKARAPTDAAISRSSPTKRAAILFSPGNGRAPLQGCAGGPDLRPLPAEGADPLTLPDRGLGSCRGQSAALGLRPCDRLPRKPRRQ